MHGPAPKFAIAISPLAPVRVQSRANETASESPPPVRTASMSSYLTILVFVIGLAIPAGGFFVRKPEPPTGENRPLMPPPTLSTERWAIETFPMVFENYFNDRVGFRKDLLKARRWLTYNVLGDSPTNLVWLGRDGWLFVNPLIPREKPAPPETETPRFRAWAEVFRARHAYLQTRGITYVVVVARDKSAIYPEYLQGWPSRHPLPDPVAAIQEQLRGENVRILDTLPVLTAAKGQGLLYLKKDTHWNDAGAFEAYRALATLLEKATPTYRGKTLADFTPIPCHRPNSDLAMALSLPRGERGEEYLFYLEPNRDVVELPSDDLPVLLARSGESLTHLQPARWQSRKPDRPRVLLLHDSFGVDFGRLLASDCSRLTMVGTYGLPVTVVEEEQPQIVVQLLVDRTFRNTVPKNSPEVTGAVPGATP